MSKGVPSFGCRSACDVGGHEEDGGVVERCYPALHLCDMVHNLRYGSYFIIFYSLFTVKYLSFNIVFVWIVIKVIIIMIYCDYLLYLISSVHGL